MITGMLLGGVTAWAMGPRHGHAAHLAHGYGPHRTAWGGGMGRLAALHADLAVTDEQREQIHAVVQSYRDEFAPLVRDLTRTRRALHDAVVSPSGDNEEIKRKAGELGDSVAAASLVAAEVVREIRPLLTAEQIEQLETLNANRQAAVEQWFDSHEERTEETE